MKTKVNNFISSAAEKQHLKQLCIQFQNMIKTEDGAAFFVQMMELYNAGYSSRLLELLPLLNDDRSDSDQINAD